MYHGAHANICGELVEDIITKEYGQVNICGLIKIRLYDQPGNRPTNKSIPVILKGSEIVNKFAGSLKKGTTVWAVGKFEIVDDINFALECGLQNINGFIISLHDYNRLKIISSETSSNHTLKEKNLTSDTVKFNHSVNTFAQNLNQLIHKQ